MEILEIQMKHFGKFTNHNMKFHSGINVIYGENETGKSTMHAFVRGMFYGIGKSRGRAAKKDEYTLRQPWDNGNYFAGAIRFTSGGKVFLLERNFDHQGKAVRLICETDGEELDPERGDLDILLEGMSETAFTNTLFIGQQTGETDEGLAAAIQNFMVNARTGGGAAVDVSGAVKNLDKERKLLEGEKKQRITQQVEQLQECRMKMDYAAQELEELRKEEANCKEELQRSPGREDIGGEREISRDLFALPEEGDEEPQGGQLWRNGKIAMAVIAVMALAVSLVMEDWKIRGAAVAVILLSCLGVKFFGSRDLEYKEERRERRIRNREQQMRLREQQIRAQYQRQRMLLEQESREAPRRQRLLTNLEWLGNAVREKEIQLQTLEEEYDSLRDRGQELEELEDNLAALYLAQDTLREVTGEIYREQGQRLNKRVSEILSEITGGRYAGIFLDERMEVKIRMGSRFLNVEQVSRGTMEQVYFALRLGASELLNPGEPLPLLLDDAFAMYDDARLERTLRWLGSWGHQILLFTCQKREQEILQKIYP